MTALTDTTVRVEVGWTLLCHANSCPSCSLQLVVFDYSRKLAWGGNKMETQRTKSPGRPVHDLLPDMNDDNDCFGAYTVRFSGASGALVTGGTIRGGGLYNCNPFTRKHQT